MLDPKKWLIELMPDKISKSLSLNDEIKNYFGEKVANLILEEAEQVLLKPANDILGRSSKEFRAKLVEVGFSLIAEKNSLKVDEIINKNLILMKGCVEMLHAGSLVIDDIMDGSEERRGDKTIHLKYDVNTAICSGNWLHFWPFRLVSFTNLKDKQKSIAYDLVSRTIELCYVGQSLDTSIKIKDIEYKKIKDLCISIMDLKTGTLTGLSMALGALVAGASKKEVNAIYEFGRYFGLALQYYDDLGNIRAKNEPSKRLEDVKQMKAGGVLALVYKFYGKTGYKELVKISKSLNDNSLSDSEAIAWFDNLDFESKYRAFVKDLVEKESSKLLSKVKIERSSESFKKIELLLIKLSEAY